MVCLRLWCATHISVLTKQILLLSLLHFATTRLQLWSNQLDWGGTLCCFLLANILIYVSVGALEKCSKLCCKYTCENLCQNAHDTCHPGKPCCSVWHTGTSSQLQSSQLLWKCQCAVPLNGSSSLELPHDREIKPPLLCSFRLLIDSCTFRLFHIQSAPCQTVRIACFLQ